MTRKKPTPAFLKLLERLAPEKPRIQRDECAHAKNRKIRLCAGAHELGNAGRWYSRVSLSVNVL